MEILPGHEGKRLDRLLAATYPALSRSRIQRLISDGQIQVNGRRVRSSHRVSTGEQVAICIPPPSLYRSIQRRSLWIFFLRMTTCW